jgi:hypothetical protein
MIDPTANGEVHAKEIEEGEMGKGSEGITASIFASENNWLSPQGRSYDVRFSQQEDRGRHSERGGRR